MSTVQTIRQIPAHVLERLRTIDSCTVSNAVERLDVRLSNEGFVDNSVHCLTPKLPPMVGYACPGRIRSSVPPAIGRLYYERMDWWEYLRTVPEPRVIVLQDVDDRPGWGALMGEIHAHIARALGCVGYVTNGTVRDLPGIESTGFHLFASGLSVSHAYAHVVNFGEAVEIGSLTIHPGDLLHGDLHGVISVPVDIAGQIPKISAELLAHEQELMQACESPHFCLEELGRHIERARHGSKK